MDIKLLDYKNANQRILSTECVLCFTCANVCPKSAVRLTSRLDMVKAEHLRYR
jgi:ferredoxin-type protein NapH